MVKIRRMNHASFHIETKAKKNIFIDPYNLKTDKKADLILVTHPHFDHCSIADINRLRHDKTIVICPRDECQKRKSLGICLRPWEEAVFENMKVIAIPAYNTNKNFHPQSNGWLGFIVEVDGKRIYHAGDTDMIEEMKELGEIDYALLPVSGKYTMNASEAAMATKIIQPKVAVPMHYGDIVGDVKDAEVFKELCDCKVELL